MGGGPSINVPGPSAEERALQQEQTELLRDQRDMLSKQMREQNLLAPFIYTEAGVKPILNTKDPVTGALKNPDLAEGDILAFEKIDDPNTQTRKDIETQLLARTQAALKGELPVDPALLRDLDENEATLRETLRKNLGPGFETSTPGIQALAEFEKRGSELKDAARRGDLTLAESLSISRQGSEDARIANLLARVTGATQAKFGGAGGYSQIAQGFGNVVGQMQADRAMQTQAMIASAQAKAQAKAGMFGGLGMLGGFLGGAAINKWG